MQGVLEEQDGETLGRGAPRRKLFLATSVAQTAAHSRVDVFNLSVTGLLLGTTAALDLDEPVAIVLPDSGERLARIVWSSDNLYGCRFDVPLAESELEAALRHAIPEGPQSAGAPLADETFGQRLKRMRSASRFSMVELAERVGVTKPTLWKWETGKARPREAALDQLAAALGTTKVALLYGRGAGVDHIRADTAEGSRQPQKLAQVIARCRSEIADCAGAYASQVSITIDWG
ncbi:helix-turn-helix domain-containing protein [Qipengyuania sp. 6B39]|uniref:helix-turn-helix domain-containing protein n=1 Tax=Qipengyuania proteolytica TaxID=2867239 RepID=UPI001C89FAAE|nr:helix-turn-helix transcriptional regulator [Qipengyuania proteolytica]MBX7495015.1 helix-turn-helix domain-containing protein [Qipengyuania proteolytica]